MATKTRKPTIPTLSTDGWVFDTINKLDQALTNFMVAQASQEYGPYTVFSLPAILQKHQNDPAGFITTLQRQLEDYLNPLFEQSRIVVIMAPGQNINDPKTEIMVNIEVYDSGFITNYPSILELSKGAFNAFRKANNGI